MVLLSQFTCMCAVTNFDIATNTLQHSSYDIISYINPV